MAPVSGPKTLDKSELRHLISRLQAHAMAVCSGKCNLYFHLAELTISLPVDSRVDTVLS